MATHIPHDLGELIAIVDENDLVIGKATRKEVHEKKHLHRHVIVLIVNSKNEILLQKRRDSGLYDCSATGHFMHNQDYIDAAVRETEEELGLAIDKSKFVEVLRARNMDHGFDSFICLFEVKGDYNIDSLSIDPLEVESVGYYPIDEVIKIVEASPKGGGFLKTMKSYLKIKEYE